MKVALKARPNPNIEHYRKEDLDVAYSFTKELHKEIGTFIKAVVIFGSTARKSEGSVSDIDILVVIDDITVHLSNELINAYRIITQKIVAKVSTRLHITTLRFTSFWDYIRNSDPVGVNILRDGVALIDTGFFEPLQNLLKQGKIRPTEEAIWAYYVRAPNSLHNSRWHILQGVVDLYWAVIDSAHAALMHIGEIPPSPSHVADMLQSKLVKPRLLEAKYVMSMRKFYKLSKMIGHREIDKISGKEFDKYWKEAEEFVRRMKRLIDVK